MEQDRSGIAVIGTGYWGRNLVRNFHRLGALQMICDRDSTVAASMAEQYPGVEWCSSPHQIYQDRKIAGIVIATPAETHFPIAREALLAGKHIYVEKPFVLNEDEGAELIRLARQKKLLLMVGHIMHYHPAFIRLCQMIKQGELGRINYIYSNRLNLGKVRREENILWSFAPHDISMILALAEEFPESVSATGGNYLHRKIADVTTSHLNFPSGLKAHIFVSWLHPFKEQKLVVVGDQKMAVFDDTQPWEKKLLLFPHQIGWSGNSPIVNKMEAEHVPLKASEPLQKECEHFLQCINEGSQPVSDGKEGLGVLKVLHACQNSLDMQGASIHINPKNDNGPQQSYFVHPNSVIDTQVKIGQGTKIWHFSHILPGTKIGERCNIGQNVVAGPNVTIGNGCKVQNNVSIYSGVTLEDNVFCGPSAVFTNVHNPRSHIRRMKEIRPTLVKTGATLGANCTIVCGNAIGRYAFIGAGAVVTKDVPDHALVYGNPATQAGWMCECGHSLQDSLRCAECGTRYIKNDSGLKKT